MSNPNTASVDPAILAQAASWLLLLQEGPLDPAQQREFEHWQHLSSEHQRAWKRAQRLLARFEGLPTELAKPTLGRPVDTGRRTLVGGLALLLGAVPLVGWLGRAWLWPQAGNADYVTVRGEQRTLLLEDGTQVQLNTDTALTVEFSDTQRLLHVQRGEIYIISGLDPRASPRPLRVQTRQGLSQALGTRFSVRQFDDETLLAVYQGAVQVRPGGAQIAADANIIRAGQQVRFSHRGLGIHWHASEATLAWRDGLLLADDMPLPQWTSELMRYGDHTIAYPAALENLRISGTFPVDDLPLALSMLAQTHGLQVREQGKQFIISR